MKLRNRIDCAVHDDESGVADDDRKALKHMREQHKCCQGEAAAYLAASLCMLPFGYAFCMDSCCGGEWLFSWPGIGVLHVPSRRAAQVYSIALPMMVALTTMIWGMLRWCARRSWLAPVLTLPFVSFAIRGDIGFAIVSGLSPAARFRTADSSQHFANTLRLDHQRHSETQGFQPMLGQVDATLARRAGEWVRAQRQLWAVHLGSRGTPHFHMGFRYGAGWYRDGMEVPEMYGEPACYAIMWRALGPVYEALRESVQATTGMKTHLHLDLNPPPVLINLPFGAFRGGEHSPEVHQDTMLGRDPVHFARAVDELLPHGFAGCPEALEEQFTLTLTLKTPAVGATGLELWRYSSNETACPMGEESPARTSCIEHSFIPYHEGQFVLFRSRQFHATGHGYQPVYGFDERIVVVSFVVPCGEGDARELHILPTTPMKLDPFRSWKVMSRL